jgi:Fuc2NAc and GlcNAc transferase
MAAASAGFLAWNWSPARIFLGDAGSGFLGFFIAILAFRWEAERPGALGLVCVLNAAFIVDATWTLAARAWRRRPPSQAHRSHAYQIAARRLGSHAKVSLAVGAYDLGILLPLALLAASGRIAPIVAFLAGAAPVAAACAWLGAGREG